MRTRNMISFDWAMKNQLRNKANFEVLEGFLSELLRRKIVIQHIGESEGNKTDKDDKTNRVDILVEADGKELVIIELQYDAEYDYFQRMLYGVSKSIMEYIATGDPYSDVRKVYSVNIVYFNLGSGDDYVYHGTTTFKGLHKKDELQLTDAQKKMYAKKHVPDLYPEYYIIKVRKFNKKQIQDTLDEWIYYFKTSQVKDDFTALGMNKVREVLAFENLSDEERKDYWAKIEAKRIRDNELESSFMDGETKGRAKGKAEEKISIAKNLLKLNISIDDIANSTGLTKDEIENLINNQ